MADKFYSSFTEYFRENNPKPKVEFTFKNGHVRDNSFFRNYAYKQKESAATSEYNKQMELQKTELDTLRSGQAKTVNYGTAVSVDDITKSGIEADDERARAAALKQLEKERLGANIASMGQTSLLRGLK